MLAVRLAGAFENFPFIVCLLLCIYVIYVSGSMFFVCLCVFD